jgi:beta-lactamase superfamily II metal-dependent hydrolase
MTTPRARVRMYNAGFGDCFLLQFPYGNELRLVLIDCGKHSASRGGLDLDDLAELVVADVTELVGQPRIDVVVATHRHRDHVEGFDQPVWAGVEVTEVWMPWTENPDNPVAVDLLNRQSNRALNLKNLAAAADDTARWKEIQALADNNLTNAKAMAMLHHGFAGDPTRYYLPESEPADTTSTARTLTFTTPTLPGVTIHVLGPDRDERTIRDINPPATASYFRASEDELGRSSGDAADVLPFASFAVDQRDFPRRYPHLDLPNRGDIVNAGRTDALAVVASLDQSVNGTSLMLAFEYRGATMLFPGDAQWGTWRAALDDPRRKAILAATDIYKVGHHGSHNATPRPFVEECVNHAQAALVSVAPTNIASWQDIPRPPLLSELQKPGRCRQLLRSDEPPSRSRSPLKRGPNGDWIELEVISAKT